MTKITRVVAREILDSRGNPTVEVELSLGSTTAVADVPSGASTGVHEALELRDGDRARYSGQGVLKVVGNVNGEIQAALVGKEFSQSDLDATLIALDGTENKSRLGANAILGVSMAFARACALEEGVELYEYLGSLVGNGNFKLPQPMLNVINGGKHADSGLDVQEFMLAPVGFDSFHRKIQAGSEVIHALREILKKKGYAVSVGDEGGFAPKLGSNEEALDVMVEAIAAAGYDTDKIKIGMDCAASSFYSDGMYRLRIAGKDEVYTSDQMIAWFGQLIEKYPIMLIEDGLSEDDWAGFQKLESALGGKVKIVGDDLLVTNTKRIQKAIDEKAVNSVLIKLNQIGTVTETIQAVQMTQKAGWAPFVSHRSGETADTFIADMAVGLGCPLIKSGALVRGERVVKYNRLMKIEEGLGSIV